MIKHIVFICLCLFFFVPTSTAQTKKPIRVFQSSGIQSFLPFALRNIEQHTYDQGGHLVQSDLYSVNPGGPYITRVFYQNNLLGLPVRESHFSKVQGQSMWQFTSERRISYSTGGLKLSDSLLNMKQGIGLSLSNSQTWKYDGQLRLIEYTSGNDFQNSPHVILNRLEYTYDSQGNQTQEVHTAFNPDGTINSTTTIIKNYDSNQRVIELVSVFNNQSQNATSKTEITYGQLGVFSTLLVTSQLNNSTGQYAAPFKRVTIIDSTHYRLQTTELTTSGSWQNTSRIEDTFVFNRKPKTSIEYAWNVATLKWDTTFINTNIYSADKDLLESNTYQDGSNGQMYLSFQEVFDYTQFLIEPADEVVRNPNSLVATEAYLEKTFSQAINPFASLSNQKKRIQKFNTSGELISATTEYEDGRAWIPRVNEYYTNQTDGRPLKILFKKVNPDNLTETTAGNILFNYNSANNLISKEVRCVDLITGMEQTTEDLFFIYDTENRLVESGFRHLNNNIVMEGQKEVFHYDGFGRIEKIDKHIVENGTFVPQKRTTNVYVGNDMRPVLQEFQLWAANTWQPIVARNTFSYEVQKTTIFDAELVQGNWQIKGRTVLDYDPQSSLNAITVSVWDGTLQSWVENQKTSFTHDAANRLITEKSWSKSFDVYFQSSQKDFTYPIINSTNQTDLMTFEVHPNPVNDFIHIQCMIDASQLQLINQAGVTVRTISNPESFEVLPVSELPDGLYYLVIHGYDTYHAEKIVIHHN